MKMVLTNLHLDDDSAPIPSVGVEIDDPAGKAPATCFLITFDDWKRGFESAVIDSGGDPQSWSL
jgi:hypothetical protein